MDLFNIVRNFWLRNTITVSLTIYRSLGAIVVLTLASMSPILQGFVADIAELQEQALGNIRPWAFSSLEAVINILDELQRKHKLLSRMQSSVA